MDIQEIKHIAKFIIKKDYRKSVWKKLNGPRVVVSRVSEDAKTPNIMVLQRHNTKVGMFSDYIVFLKTVETAIQRNSIPIIDRQTIKNAFLPADDDVNTWELFFEQPMKMGLGDIRPDVMNVTVLENIGVDPVSILHCKDLDTVKYWRKFAKKYMRFNAEMQQHLQESYDKLLAGKNVLGVSVREGYQKLANIEPRAVSGHPVQTEVKKIIDDVALYMKQWNCEYVFIACQTTETMQKFKNQFGDKLIHYERTRVSYQDLPEGSDGFRKIKADTAKQNEQDYITEMYLLSRCNCFICSENSGSEAAFIMSEGFNNFLCYDNGIYK